MRESKLKSYKSAFMSSVVNNELFNDRGLCFFIIHTMLYNAHHVNEIIVYSVCMFVNVRDLQCRVYNHCMVHIFLMMHSSLVHG